MTDYYCDISEETFADNAGTATGTAYTGPAGLQAAMRGTGNATALAAGDALYIKTGTGDLSRLVLLDCNGTDVSAWAPTNVVRNKDGAGDDWTGVVVQANDDPAGNLGADDLVLVWLDSGLTEDDIDLADGIENTTLAENADPLAAKSTPGVCLEVNGTTTSYIDIVGVNSSWVEDDETLAVLDGNDKAPGAFVLSAARKYYNFRNIHATQCTGSAWGQGDELTNCILTNCIGSESGSGFGGTDWISTCILANCKAYNNSGYGFFLIYSFAANCTGYNNGTYGFYQYRTFAANCAAFENTDYGFRLANSSSLVNCVADNNGSGVYNSHYSQSIVGCRITNNTNYGAKDTYAGGDYYCFYSGNGANFENGYMDDTVRGASTRVTSGTVGYIDADNADLSLRNYGLTNQAAARRQAVVL